MIEPTFSLAGQVCFWFSMFYLGRAVADDGAPWSRGGYEKKFLTLLVAGWILLFIALALGTEVDTSMTSQEVGQLGLYFVAFFSTSIIGGYRFEKWRKKLKEVK